MATVEKIEEAAEKRHISQDDILSETLDLEQRVVLALGNAWADDNMVVMAGNFIKALQEEGVVLSVKKP